MEPTASKAPKDKGMHRIGKAIADAGYTSRRQAEKLIQEQRVFVNDRCVLHPSLVVSDQDHIVIDGKPLERQKSIRAWKFYKPRGLITTHSDTHKRPTVFDYIKQHYPHIERVVSVGRLDLLSEGLLLLTNSGDFAQYAQSPSTLWTRTYKVRFYGKLTQDISRQLCQGLMIKNKLYRLHSLQLLPSERAPEGKNQWVKVTLQTGKNREIRELFGFFDIQISRLIRVSYGPFHIEHLTPGTLEEIASQELTPYLPSPLKGSLRN